MLNILINKQNELTKGESKVLRKIKQLYKNVENEVYIYSQAKLGNKRPDFIIIDNKRGIVIIEVKDWEENYIESITNRRVKLIDKEVDNPIIQVKGYKSTLESALYNNDFDIDNDEIGMVIWFTNIENKNNDKLKLLFKEKINYCFKEDVEKIDLNRIFNNTKVNYTELNLKEIRLSLFPELEVIKNIDNEIDVFYDEKTNVLDFEQEEFVRKIPIGHYLITGVPGSGKTVILISRAIHLIRENPEWKILIVTYNKSLVYKLEEKINKLDEKFSKNESMNISLANIEVSTFHKVAYNLLNGKRKPIDMPNDEWYGEEMPRLAKINAREVYDAVLVDEYQDFRKSWIELCLKLAKTFEYNGQNMKNIFLAGDRLQGIYNEKEVSWASIGINMQGRSKLLKTSYRGATEHMKLAIKFLNKNTILRNEVNKFYKDEGEKFEIKAKENGKIEIREEGDLENIIRSLKSEGYKNKDILILVKFNDEAKRIKLNLSYDISLQVEHIKNIQDEDKIIITTYQSAKGLEAKAVILTSIDIGINKDDKLCRKIIYVGITRASEKLYIIKNKAGKYVKEIEEILE